tara:strand:+ start:883 stop:1092 length:210 start_codon:yes stop_codon:yes gene_type:complete
LFVWLLKISSFYFDIEINNFNLSPFQIIINVTPTVNSIPIVKINYPVGEKILTPTITSGNSLVRIKIIN